MEKDVIDKIFMQNATHSKIKHLESNSVSNRRHKQSRNIRKTIKAYSSCVKKLYSLAMNMKNNKT